MVNKIGPQIAGRPRKKRRTDHLNLSTQPAKNPTSRKEARNGAPGKGYQTRINAILRSYMEAQSNNAQ